MKRKSILKDGNKKLELLPNEWVNLGKFQGAYKSELSIAGIPDLANHKLFFESYGFYFNLKNHRL